MKITIEAPTKQMCTAIADSYESGKPIKFAGQKFHINGWCKHFSYGYDNGLFELEIDAIPLPDKSPTAEDFEPPKTNAKKVEIKISLPHGNYGYKSKGNEVVGNSWHQLGEFPPVGTVCEYLRVPSENIYHQCEIIYINGREIAFVTPDEPNRIFVTQQDDFRPIKTEKEKFVEAVAMVIDQCAGGNSRFIAGEMFDTGEFKYQPK